MVTTRSGFMYHLARDGGRQNPVRTPGDRTAAVLRRPSLYQVRARRGRDSQRAGERMKQRPWSSEDDRVLRDAWDDGIPARTVAEQLGRTPDAVRQRAYRLGLKSNYLVVASGPQTPHGTAARYRRGCRCKLCTKANADYGRPYSRAYKQRQREQREPAERTGQ